MVEVSRDSLVISFPEIHPHARLRVTFQRTLRIPDDGKAYPLPPGLGAFPLRHVDDFAARAPQDWLRRGGVMLPMYQSEATWLHFAGEHDPEREATYPFAVKIAAGKINAVTGEGWAEGVTRGPQDYMVVPTQPWLDGFCVEKGFIRQFVAMPLGGGYSAEEQLTGKAEFGGIQVLVYPMRRDVYERRFPKVDPRFCEEVHACEMAAPACAPAGAKSMGLAPGGRMKQEIFRDPYELGDWDLNAKSRCFVHLCNALAWREITGENPPTTPFTAKEYTRAGLPWFDWYGGDAAALEGAAKLAGLKSVAEVAKQKGDATLDDGPITPEKVIQLRAGLRPGQVREGGW
ncbi:MAG: hypothetical protein ACOZNI_13965 [Myxococcota bacterium]